MDVRTVHKAAQVMAAAELFDQPPTDEWTRRFLDDPGHHMLLAYVDDRPVGMVTGVEMTHPDKGTEMFLYELAVAEDFRRRGVGRGLTEALGALATERGCYGMWVLTEPGNTAAVATYRGTDATEDTDVVLFTWDYANQA